MAKLIFKINSKCIDGPSNTIIYIPDKLIRNGMVEKSKVVYMLHGKNGDEESFGDYSNAYNYADKYSLILVIPSMANSFYLNMEHGMRYFDYLSEELPLYLSNTLRLNSQKEYNFLLGYSMGGFGALKLGLTNPDKYKGICSLSGSLRSLADTKYKIEHENRMDLKLAFGDCNDKVYEENDIYYLTNKILYEKKTLPELDIYCGRKDSLYEVNKRYINFLEDKGIRFNFTEDEGQHSFDSWDKEIERYFRLISK